MGSTFEDLDRYYDPGLRLTVHGKIYTVPLPSAALGLWCQRITQAAGAIGAAGTDEEMRAAVERINALPDLEDDGLTMPQRLLGATYDEMVEDGVEHPFIEFCGATAFWWVSAGEEVAGRYWRSGGRPEAVSPANRATRRAAAKKATGGSRTAAAAATRSRASTSGTSTPRKSAAKKAAPSRGKRS